MWVVGPLGPPAVSWPPMGLCGAGGVFARAVLLQVRDDHHLRLLQEHELQSTHTVSRRDWDHGYGYCCCMQCAAAGERSRDDTALQSMPMQHHGFYHLHKWGAALSVPGLLIAQSHDQRWPRPLMINLDLF